MKSVLLLGAVLLAACEGSTTPVSPSRTSDLNAAVVRNDRIDRGAYVISDCTGEFIAVDAQFHYVTAVTFDATGSYHVVIHRNVEFSGRNEATGAEYVGQQVDNQTYTIAAASEFTSVTHFTLVGKGAAPNEVAELLTHYTITPDGQITADRYDIRIDCHE